MVALKLNTYDPGGDLQVFQETPTEIVSSKQSPGQHACCC